MALEYRYLDGRYEGVSAVFSELLRLDINVIVAHDTPAAVAAKQTARAVPIVMFEVGDPVGAGLVPSLASVVDCWARLGPVHGHDTVKNL